MNMNKYFWTLLIGISCIGNIGAATWLKAEDGQWLYVDDYLPLSLFINPQSEAKGNIVFHGSSMPLEATQKAKMAYFEIQAKGDTYELWYKNDSTTSKIIDLTAEGFLFFKEHNELRCFFSRKVRFVVKELPNNEFVLWDVDKNEKIITLSEQGIESFRNDPETEIMIIESEDD